MQTPAPKASRATATGRPRAPRARSAPAAVDLALQGGGSHGAFTWGVLDALLEDESLALDGVSGTSAGALNAAVLASGWAAGGRQGARGALRAFWHDVARQGACFGRPSWPSWPVAGVFGGWPWPAAGPLAGLGAAAPGLAAFNLDHHPFYGLMQQFLHSFSPYQFNPYDLNPLREVVARHVDADALRRGPLSLFVTATAVRSGQPRVFTREDLSTDALLASACLPQLFRAVVVDGEPYWDGGYSGNPAIWPLIYGTAALDIVLVKINPLWRPQLPDSAAEIADRVNEITFNAGLVSEMRAIAFVQRLVDQGRLDAGEYKQLRLHMVADDEGLAPLQPSSKLNTDRAFLDTLHGLGRDAAARWLREQRPQVGRRSTLDLASTFLTPRR
jgi:NTE family protein